MSHQSDRSGKVNVITDRQPAEFLLLGTDNVISTYNYCMSSGPKCPDPIFPGVKVAAKYLLF